MNELPDSPLRLTLELTNECNYRCSMCPSRLQADVPRGYMEPGLFKKIVDQAAAKLPVTLVPFFRGESLLHPEIAALIAYAKQKGLGPVQLASNGSLLNADMAGALLDSGLDFISFSLDAIDPQEYALMRPGGNLARVQKNVLAFMERRDKGAFATTVQVSATRTGLNHKSIDRFIEFWGDKADRTRIYYEHSQDGHTGSLDCPEVPREMERRPCAKLYSDMVVYFNGEVALCNHDWFRQEPLGDLNQQTVAEVWRGPAYNALRAQHQDPSTLTDQTCRHCDHWKIAYLEDGLVGELYLREERRASRAAL